MEDVHLEVTFSKIRLDINGTYTYYMYTEMERVFEHWNRRLEWGLSLYVHLNRIEEEDQALFNLCLKPLSVAVMGQMSSAFRPFYVGNLVLTVRVHSMHV